MARHSVPQVPAQGANGSSEGKLVRCAIYTRKSTEEGLQQEFNSLDAQREASEAFVASQKHEGWQVITEHFDDGGYTGGNMDRPALKRLLAAVDARSVDCIIVYKVDRLSRSLLDFARIIEVFDRNGVSFVAVTQQFNTTPLASALAVRIQSLQVRAPGVFALGVSNSRSTRNHPVYFFVFSRCRDFTSAVHEVAISCPTSFVAVAPTNSFLTVELREVLDRRKSDFISLEDRVGLSEDGRFVALEIGNADEITPTPVEQRHAAVEKYKSDFTCTDEDVFEDATVHKSDFYKWKKGTLSDKSSKSKRVEETLRRDPRRRTRS